MFRGVRLALVVATVAGLLAGALGGALGYLLASGERGPRVVLGGAARGGSVVSARPVEQASVLVARVLPSVVTVSGTSWFGDSLGSGFVISADGYVLTNAHVVAGMTDTGVKITLADATTLTGRVVGRDSESDLAVIKVSRSGLRPVELADSDALRVGDGVLAIGSPLALSGTVTAGIVSAIDRTIATTDEDGGRRYYAAIQTDASVNHGSSGGPLFDLAGRVVGVNSMIKALVENGQESGNIGIAFAIPINQAVRVATELIENGRARRTVIGAQLETYRGYGSGSGSGSGSGAWPAAGAGVRLRSVDAGGPAAKGGLRVGDVIIRLGTHPVAEASDLIALVRRYDPGTPVTIGFRRGATTRSAKIILAADAN